MKNFFYDARRTLLALIIGVIGLGFATQEAMSYCDVGYGRSYHTSYYRFTWIDLDNDGEREYDDFNSEPRNHYQDLTKTVLKVDIGDEYTMRALNIRAGNDYVAMWIDFNQDNEFSKDELVIDGFMNSTNEHTFTYTIPDDAKVGETRMRIIYSYDPDGGYSPDPCSIYIDSYGWDESYGCAYDFTVEILEPTDMVYESIMNEQPTTLPIRIGSNDNTIVRANVRTDGVLKPLSATSLTFTTDGTTRTADLSAAKIFYSGRSATGANAVQLGSVINNPNGTHTVNFTRELNKGNNYFWLVYDVPSNATEGNFADGAITSITVAGTARTPATSNPAGTRELKNALSGEITVGSGGKIPTIQQAVQEVELLGLRGNTTFKLLNDFSLSEPLIIFPWNEYNGSNYWLNFTAEKTVTITGNFNATTSSGQVGGSVLVVAGVSRLKFDGGKDRNIIIKHGNTTTYTWPTTLLMLNATVAGATRTCNDVEFTGVRFIGPDVWVYSYNVWISGGVHNRITFDNSVFNPCVRWNTTTTMCLYQASSINDFTLTNNKFENSFRGFYQGTTATRLVFNNNIVGDENGFDNSISCWGAEFRSTITTGEINDNKFYNIGTNNTAHGISSPAAAIFVSGANTNLKILRNEIKGVKYLRTTTNAVAGIWFQNGTSPIIANNSISDIVGSGSGNIVTSNLVQGITIRGGTGHRIYHNTVHMSGDFFDLTNARGSAALHINGAYASMDIRNNIFSNTMTNNNSTTKSWIVAVNGTPPATWTVNNNIYWGSGSRSVFGLSAGADRSTFTDWKNANTALDGASFNVEPQFIAANNPRLTGSSVGNPSFLTNTLLTDCQNDVDNEVRRTSNRHMGADEAVPQFAFNPNITQFPGIRCAGSSFTLTFTPQITYGDGYARALNTNFPTYSWFKNGTQMPGISGSSLTINNAKATDYGTYMSRASFLGVNAFTGTSFLNIEEAMAITTQPANFEGCLNNPIHTLSIVGTGTFSSYQWQKRNVTTGNWENIPGANAANYTYNMNNMDVLRESPFELQNTYRVVMTGPGNCGPAQLISGQATIKAVRPLTGVGITPVPASGEACENTEFTITAEGEGTIYAYQWQRFNGIFFEDLDIQDYPAANSKVFRIVKANFTDAGNYRARITGAGVCGDQETYTLPVRIEVLEGAKVLIQPEPIQICGGESFSLATSIDGDVLKYQWQKDGVDLDVAQYPFADRPFFYLDDAEHFHSGVYRCVVTVDECRGIIDLITDEVVVFVQSKTRVTRQPLTRSVVLGEDVSLYFDAHVEGEKDPLDVSIQWYRGDEMLRDDVTRGGRIAGARSNRLSISRVQPNDLRNDYYAIVRGICGVDTTRRVGITEQVVINLISAPVNQTACEATTATFTVEAQASVAGYNLNYQWRKNGNFLSDNIKYDGSNTPSLTVSYLAKEDMGNYDCIISSDPGIEPVISPRANLMLELKAIMIDKSDDVVAVEVDKELDLMILVDSDTPEFYQWRKDGVDLAGENDMILSIANVTVADAGAYSVVVTNDCGDVEFAVSNVTITTGGFQSVETGFDGDFALIGNSPNPVNNETVITFMSAISGEVKLVLTDLQGREVAELFNGMVEAGQHTVNVNVANLNIVSGVYTYSLIANGTMISKQMVINR